MGVLAALSALESQQAQQHTSSLVLRSRSMPFRLRRVAEEVAGDVAELDTDLGAPVGQGLAGLEEEGHAVPARVVDEQRDRSKGGAQAAGTGRRALSCLECVHTNLWCRPTPCETSAKGQPYTSADG